VRRSPALDPHPSRGRPGTGPRIAERLAPWFTTAALFLLWQSAVLAFRIESFILPSPAAAFAAMYAHRGALWSNALSTLYTTLSGFAISVAVGSALGISVGSSRLVYKALYPVLVGFNSVPKAGLVPILVIWFGVSAAPSIITAFVLSFFPIVVNIAAGFAAMEPELLDVLRSLGATPLDIVTKIGMPRSVPYFFASLKIAITLAFVGSVVSELVAGNQGIGHVMLVAGSSFDVPLVFAALLVVSAMGIGMYGLFALLERRMTGWSVRALDYGIGS
jgi:NitT/TauT family transport system permease protein